MPRIAQRIRRSVSVVWAHRCPDLRPLDFFIWSYLKSYVYQMHRLDSREQLFRHTYVQYLFIIYVCSVRRIATRIKAKFDQLEDILRSKLYYIC